MCGMQTTTISKKRKLFQQQTVEDFCFESIVAANHYTHIYIYIMQKHICYFSEVFGYYNCVTVLTIILL